MNEKQSSNWVAFLAVGMLLNMLGIVLTSLGWPRYVLMACGLGLLLTAVMQVQKTRGTR